MPTVIDLFSGCGGLSLGLHKAGWQGLFAIEKSPDAFKTLKYNLMENTNPSHFDWPDWLEIKNWEINTFLKTYKPQLKDLEGHIDLVAGGPPCQGFSTAGKRMESDIRNQLVHSYLKIIKYVHPKMLLFENVKGFTQEFKKNKEKGIAYSVLVKKRLERLGYKVEARLINFGDYGVPQRRTRFILVGIAKDYFGKDTTLARDFFEKLESNKDRFLKERGLSVSTTLSDAISDLWKVNGTVRDRDFPRFLFGKYKDGSLTPYQMLMRKDIDTSLPHPDSHRFANHTETIHRRFQQLLDYTEEQRNKDLGEDIKRRFNIKKHTIIPLDGQQKSPTLTTLPDDYIHYKEPRILTVREYARIQSFPDNYILQGKYTTGGTLRTKEAPRYTQIGNAIPPLFGEQAGLVLREILENGRA